jgi:hypothetical protein
MPYPLAFPSQLARAGVLPIRKGPARFAVGPPDGLSSNSWNLWSNRKGDLYVACRDNFKEAKVSLHASGRWRMGFTSEALAKNPNLVPLEGNRAWEVWDQPPPQLPNVTIAFRLYFPTSELAVRPEQRQPDQWREVVFIEPAPPGTGKLAALSLFVTNGDVEPKHDSEPSFRLASLAIGHNMHAQLFAHGEPEGSIPKIIEGIAEHAQLKVRGSGQEMPAEAYIYAVGRSDDGFRFFGRRSRQSIGDGEQSTGERSGNARPLAHPFTCPERPLHCP